MKVRTLALALLLTLPTLPVSARSPGAPSPPVCPHAPTFTLVPLSDNQVVIRIGNAAAASSACAGPKIEDGGRTVLVGKIRRPGECFCDPATDPDCACAEDTAWKATLSKIRRPVDGCTASTLGVEQGGLCDPATDPTCACAEAAGWKALISKIRRPIDCQAATFCDPATDPDCTCDEGAAWTVLVSEIRRPIECLCNLTGDPSCVCTEDGTGFAPITRIRRSSTRESAE